MISFILWASQASNTSDWNSTAVLGGVVVIAAGILAGMLQRLYAKVDKLAQSQTRLETLIADVATGGLVGEIEKLTLRIERVERRHGPDDRRQQERGYDDPS